MLQHNIIYNIGDDVVWYSKIYSISRVAPLIVSSRHTTKVK